MVQTDPSGTKRVVRTGQKEGTKRVVRTGQKEGTKRVVPTDQKEGTKRVGPTDQKEGTERVVPTDRNGQAIDCECIMNIKVTLFTTQKGQKRVFKRSRFF